MEHTELAIYNDTAAEPVSDNKEYSFAAILTLIVGLIGVLAAGGSLPADTVEMLPMVAATAVPGLLAWVLTCLYANMEYDVENEEVPALG